VVIAAEQYASRLVVPQSQRAPATRWSSHKELAAKALTKLASPHLPASLRELDTAVKRAHEERERAFRRASVATQRASRTAARDNDAAAPKDAGDVEAEVEVDVEEAEQ
jgi:transcriptional regulator with GAF, ATPase, and Fis domain